MNATRRLDPMNQTRRVLGVKCSTNPVQARLRHTCEAQFNMGLASGGSV